MPLEWEDGEAFVEDVMRRTGAENVRALSRMLGWDGSDRERRLYDWAKGGNPNFEGTIALLKVAGLLQEPTGRATATTPAASNGDAELAQAVERLAGALVDLGPQLDQFLRDQRSRVRSGGGAK